MLLPRHPPWIDKNTQKICFINRIDCIKNYKKTWYINRVTNFLFREDCELKIQKAKSNYLKKVGNTLINPQH